MKTLLIVVFVSVVMCALPVKAELFRLDSYGHCTIYEEIDEFTDKLEGYHFICGDDHVFMSLSCNKKEENSRRWALIFNGSSHIIHLAETNYVAGKIRIGKQPMLEFGFGEELDEARVRTATSFKWKKRKYVDKIIEGLRSSKLSGKQLIFRAGVGNTETIPLTGKEKDGIDPWLAKCKTLVKR